MRLQDIFEKFFDTIISVVMSVADGIRCNSTMCFGVNLFKPTSAC